MFNRPTFWVHFNSVPMILLSYKLIFGYKTRRKESLVRGHTHV